MSKSRGQTAIEELFILMILVVGAIVIIPNYIENDAKNLAIVNIRDVAKRACDYINMGVIVDDPTHEPLNAIIENSTSEKCYLERIEINEGDMNISVRVKVKFPRNISEAVREFMIRALEERGFKYNGTLIYNGIGIEVEVEG
ncbi:hypothetical protein [Pyrococcus abyssi]|uniref:hypothetical protein n=1 Tax=Pyrococcus abyssi TaxID=29292 RepID=UPI000A8B459C|nr:hypothetical protein [Pyrococcus abyssi]